MILRQCSGLEVILYKKLLADQIVTLVRYKNLSEGGDLNQAYDKL